MFYFYFYFRFTFFGFNAVFPTRAGDANLSTSAVNTINRKKTKKKTFNSVSPLIILK